MDYRPGAHPAPTLSLIHETLKNIEGYLEWYAQYSETMRLALPLLGCGVGGLEKREVIELYKTFFSHQVDFDCDIFVRITSYNVCYTKLLRCAATTGCCTAGG